jgi:hypothetical protein
MLSQVSEAFGIQKEDVFRELDFRNEVDKVFGFPDRNIPCTLNFHVFPSHGKLKAAGEKITYRKTGNRILDFANITRNLIRVYGFPALFGWLLLLKLRIRAPFLLNTGNLKSVTLLSFWDKYGVDLDDLKKCRIQFIGKDKTISCCLANILREKDDKLLYQRSC